MTTSSIAFTATAGYRGLGYQVDMLNHIYGDLRVTLLEVVTGVGG
jgi:hypothetical protein